MVSVQDIADRLGVSRSTVSLVLSGKAGSRVSEDVKKKVFQTARELNYHVNEIARSLRTGSSRLISVIVTDISNEFFGRLTFHIQEEAKKAGYLVLTINTNENPKDFGEMVRVLIGKQVDGIIAVPPSGGEPDIAHIQAMGLPVVTVDRPCEGVDVNYVGVDNYAGARSAMDALIRDGYRDVALVALDLDIPPLNERRDAYRDALAAAGLQEHADIRLIPFGREEEVDIVRILQGLSRKDAVFFTSRRAFTQTMAQLAWNGLAVRPEQCLLCFDDVQPYLTVHANLRYVEQPVEEMARKAFSLLMDQIQGRQETGRYLFHTRCIYNHKI